MNNDESSLPDSLRTLPEALGAGFFGDLLNFVVTYITFLKPWRSFQGSGASQETIIVLNHRCISNYPPIPSKSIYLPGKEQSAPDPSNSVPF